MTLLMGVDNFGYIDDVQAALWAYLYMVRTSGIFGINENGFSALDIKYQAEMIVDTNHIGFWKSSDFVGAYETGENVTGNSQIVGGSHAWEYYNEAWNTFIQGSDKHFSGKIYKLTNVGSPNQAKGAAQEILIVQKATTPDEPYEPGGPGKPDEPEKPYEPEVTINFQKQNFTGQALSAAIIKFTNVENAEAINGKSISSKNDGTFSIKFKPTKNTGTFKVKIEETRAPSGYVAFKDGIILTVEYNTKTGAVTKVTSDNNWLVLNGTGTVIVKNCTVAKLKFKKIDIYGTAVAGAKIKITGGYNVDKIAGLDSNGCLIASGTTGEYNQIIVTPIDPTEYFELDITEINVPEGYKGFGTKTLRVDYERSSGNVVTAYALNGNKMDPSIVKYGDYIAIKNTPEIASLELLKTDAATGNKLFGAKFKITLTGVESIKNYSSKVNNGKIILTDITTNPLGKITLSDLVFSKDNNKRITIRIEETETPPTDGSYYYKPIDPIEFTISYEVVNGKAVFKLVNAPQGVSLKGNVVTLDVKNQSFIKLSGKVWLDGQQGIKVIEGPNGIKENNESGVGGILVELCEPGTNRRAVSDEKYWTVTKDDGTYEFKDIPATQKGYYVKFNYDGINYIETKDLVSEELIRQGSLNYNGRNYSINTNGLNIEDRNNQKNQLKLYGTGNLEIPGLEELTASKAFENHKERVEFNSEHKSVIGTTEEVSSGFGEVTNGYIVAEGARSQVPLLYNCDGKDGCKALLQTTIDGRNPGQVRFYKSNDYYAAEDFRVSARSGNYKVTTENIDFGIVKKELDLAIGTDVESARLEINGKSTTYNYQQIIDGEMEDLTLDKILDNKSSDNDEIYYNFYLYESDYNYRISDYRTDVEGGIENEVNPEDSKTDDYMDLKELEAYVTYNIILKNQTTTEAYVDEFMYYYDAAFTPISINGKSIDSLINGEKVDEYTITVDSEARTIRFRARSGRGALLGESEDAANNFRREILIEFRVNKNADGYVELKDNCSNVAEITGYTSASGGFVDVDSAPANAGVTFDNQGTANISKHYEDDTDKSLGLNISIKSEAQREIKGTVFDDTDGDGKLNEENGAVNDVIVQLIEILPIESPLDGQIYNCEYIWQETRSGSNTVKKLSRDGNIVKETQYPDNIEVGKGEFVFRDFIPGDYIIRYIYGDGSTYDATEDVKTYNGQDYKSTNDPHYNEKEFYNELMNVYGENSSVARDNELRRLEVMSYSPIINKDIGSSLVEKTSKDGNDKTGLDYTWMAAETSKINVPVDVGNGEDLQKTDNERTVAYENITNNNLITFNGMNFGLTLRPETSITLEKHITGLKITPNGVGAQPIVDATADIERILDVDVLSVGVVTGLATDKSTRGNRGFWKVETDVEELMQGAQLEVEYTYVVVNDGEDDYLSRALIERFKADPNTYSNYLKDTVNEIKIGELNGLKGKTNEYGNYLGQFYYTGVANEATDVLVPTRIETNGLEEAINNDLAFENGEFFNKVNGEAVAKTVYNTDREERTENIETVIHNVKSTEFLTPGERDFSNKVTLRTVLASTNGGELGANIPSYIAEVIKYSNAAGRRDMQTQPENLKYVHSKDNTMTVENSNEEDEFWGESVIITKPTGEDKISTMQIAIITVLAVAVLGVGIILIKKFALKK